MPLSSAPGKRPSSVNFLAASFAFFGLPNSGYNCTRRVAIRMYTMPLASSRTRTYSMVGLTQLCARTHTHTTHDSGRWRNERA